MAELSCLFFCNSVFLHHSLYRDWNYLLIWKQYNTYGIVIFLSVLHCWNIVSWTMPLKDTLWVSLHCVLVPLMAWVQGWGGGCSYNFRFWYLVLLNIQTKKETYWLCLLPHSLCILNCSCVLCLFKCLFKPYYKDL